MENRTQEIAAFFDHYADGFRQSSEGKKVDVKATAASFADWFIEASPLGVMCGQNNAKFRKMIPKGMILPYHRASSPWTFKVGNQPF